MSGVGDNTILNWTAELNEFEQQLADIQKSKKDFYARVRDEHGKKVAASLKEAVRLFRMDSTKRLEAEEIDAEAFRILQVIERGPSRAAHVRVENIEEFDAETGEVTEPQRLPAAQSLPDFAPVANESDGRSGDESPVNNSPETATETQATTPLPEDQGQRAAASIAQEHWPAEANGLVKEPSEPEGSGGVQDRCESTPPPNSTIVQFNRDETTEERCLRLRPHCLNPSACAGVGKNHCFGCRKAVTSMTGETA
jgi:hypothetical protein